MMAKFGDPYMRHSFTPNGFKFVDIESPFDIIEPCDLDIAHHQLHVI